MNRHYFELFFGILSIIVVISSAVPLDSSIEKDDAELIDGDLIDDMIVDHLRNAAIAKAKRWPKAIVRYKISRDFDENHLANITSAMSSIEAVSCIRFFKAGKRTKNYVSIVSGLIGCTSGVGYRGGVQILKLSTNTEKCLNPGTIMHELMHTLGFYHQHMAVDRDGYITINWENIIPEKKKFFGKLDKESTTDFGYGYDYESILHYPRDGFSVNGLDTISTLDGEVEIGQRVRLSDKDIGKLNAMYKCAKQEASV